MITRGPSHVDAPSPLSATNNYFKVTELDRSISSFYFFDDRDPASMGAAFDRAKVWRNFLEAGSHRLVSLSVWRDYPGRLAAVDVVHPDAFRQVA